MLLTGNSSKSKPVSRVGICGKWKDRLDVRLAYHLFVVAIHLAFHLSDLSYREGDAYLCFCL